MPKTTKRTATKRVERIAKAHATELPKLEVKESPLRRSPGYKRPARGLARYPWATVLTLLIIALGIYTLYFYHVGPFALPKPKPKATVVATPIVLASACSVPSMVSKLTDTAPAPDATTFNATKHSYAKAPTLSIDTKKIYCAGINTNRGLIVVELNPTLAPKTVNNFVFLAQNKFFDGTVFHRVLSTGSLRIIQGGDPLGNDPAKRGTGGPGYKFADEPVQGNYTLGAIAMANSGANTNGSQFFICTSDDTAALQKSYNLFGRVVKGIEVAQKTQGPGDDAATKNITPDTINHVVIVAA